MKTYLAIALCGILFAIPYRAIADDDLQIDLTSPPPPQASSDDVAATVNNEPITLDAVNETIQSVLQGRAVDPASRKQLQANILSQLIDRALVMQMLARTGKAVPSTTVTQALESLKKQAEEQKVDFIKMLKNRGLTEKQCREQLAWQINWGHYVQTAVTDATLKTYFEAHQRDFDGTELRVSHILLRPDGAATAADAERLKKMAEKLREQIQSGKIKFEDAAERYSAGPSRRKGGDLGFIPRKGLMPEPFAAAAFKLEEGELSQPVATAYGLHLIKATEAKRGRKIWLEVKDQLKAPAAQDLFDKLAAKEHENAKIEYTGKCPHFKPGTKELANDAE